MDLISSNVITRRKVKKNLLGNMKNVFIQKA
jgi:hypothetical protein